MMAAQKERHPIESLQPVAEGSRLVDLQTRIDSAVPAKTP